MEWRNKAEDAMDKGIDRGADEARERIDEFDGERDRAGDDRTVAEGDGQSRLAERSAEDAERIGNARREGAGFSGEERERSSTEA